MFWSQDDLLQQLLNGVEERKKQVTFICYILNGCKANSQNCMN